MRDPPSLAGAVQLTTAAESLTGAVGLVGVPGRPNGVIWPVDADGAPVPPALMARMRNSMGVPFARPKTLATENGVPLSAIAMPHDVPLFVDCSIR